MTETTEHTPEYQGWALLEIMGHRQTAGKVTEVRLGGATMIRVDVPRPDSDEIAVTQYYGGGSIYCMTPCDEATARRALQNRYSLPDAVQLALPPPAQQEDFDLG